MTDKERIEMKEHEAKLDRIVQRLSREDFSYIVSRYAEINRVEKFDGTYKSARGDLIEYSIKGTFDN